jgi:hypothetical protein
MSATTTTTTNSVNSAAAASSSSSSAASNSKIMVRSTQARAEVAVKGLHRRNVAEMIRMIPEFRRQSGKCHIEWTEDQSRSSKGFATGYFLIQSVSKETVDVVAEIISIQLQKCFLQQEEHRLARPAYRSTQGQQPQLFKQSAQPPRQQRRQHLQRQRSQQTTQQITQTTTQPITQPTTQPTTQPAPVNQVETEPVAQTVTV